MLSKAFNKNTLVNILLLMPVYLIGLDGYRGEWFKWLIFFVAVTAIIVYNNVSGYWEGHNARD